MKLRFLYVSKPRKYNYKPRFYNPNEEEIKSLSKDVAFRTRESYTRWRKHTEKSKKQRSQNILIAIGIVLILLYFIFF